MRGTHLTSSSHLRRSSSGFGSTVGQSPGHAQSFFALLSSPCRALPTQLHRVEVHESCLVTPNTSDISVAFPSHLKRSTRVEVLGELDEFKGKVFTIHPSQLICKMCLGHYAFRALALFLFFFLLWRPRECGVDPLCSCSIEELQ